MKPLKKLSVILFLGIGIFLLTSCDKEKVLLPEKFPTEITEFVTQHFPDHNILQVTKDYDDLTLTYDVILTDRVALEFDRKKRIKDIDSDSKLPDSVIPLTILNYVNQNYPENFITDWELEDRHQQVELNNGLGLEFNMNGVFLRIDD